MMIGNRDNAESNNRHVGKRNRRRRDQYKIKKTIFVTILVIEMAWDFHGKFRMTRVT